MRLEITLLDAEPPDFGSSAITVSVGPTGTDRNACALAAAVDYARVVVARELGPSPLDANPADSAWQPTLPAGPSSSTVRVLQALAIERELARLTAPSLADFVRCRAAALLLDLGRPALSERAADEIDTLTVERGDQRVALAQLRAGPCAIELAPRIEMRS